MPRVSIIIPIYNSNHYLLQCLRSVLLQTYTDYEVLMINDGSTDDSGLVCEDFAKKDKRFRVFHKRNGGVSSARNLGLDYITGEWVMFVDSDDLLPKDSIQNLIQQTNDSVDMSLGGIRKFDDNTSDVETVNTGCNCVISVEDCIDRFIAPKVWTGDWQRYIVNRLFRASIINSFGLRFRTDIYYKEDGVFLINFLARCSRGIACVNEVVYLYRQVFNSTMGALYSSFNTKVFTNIDAHGEIYRVISRLGVSKEIIKREENHLFQNYYWIMGIMKKTNSKSLRNRIILVFRLIRNGGLLKSIEHLLFFRYGRMLKKKLSI